MSNFNSRGFPYHRGRRLRSSSNLRDVVSQVKLSLDDLVMPCFIKEIEDNAQINGNFNSSYNPMSSDAKKLLE